MEMMDPPLGEHHDAYNSMLGMNGALMMPHLNGVNVISSSAAAAAAAAVQQVNGSAASTAAANSEAQTVASNAAAATQPQQWSSDQSTLNSYDPYAAKLFVGGLSPETSSKKLRQYFKNFGRITNVVLLKDCITNSSRGYGFITFSDPETVEKVLKVPIHTLDGKNIDLKHATPKNRNRWNLAKRIFVGGLSKDISSEEVEAYFGKFGRVEETQMVINKQTNQHRGFCFISFESEDVADRVCEIHFHTIKFNRVECKRAYPKNSVQSGWLMKEGCPLRMAAPASVAPMVATQAQAQAQVQSAAYGKLYSGCCYPGLGYRYAPYPFTTPPTNATRASPATTMHTLAPTNPYQGYNLTNVDMSCFQGVDWSSMAWGVPM